MTEAEFQRELLRATTMQRIEGASDWRREAYWAGYQRGLRRAFHGETFGTPEEHRLWLSLVEDPHDEQRQQRGKGYREGFAFLP